ncbi:hypothetical protein [Barnesiella intestinihominis]|uniref:hypothetical protein n=1 Tax=Barnesiella intestinihominis TaxID=487174 RepID=UPI001D8288A1|nr:hypothetical protein [Barnesiella intestinihominis]MBS1387308.1 hypothetical protein [Barnesiella sp.]
MSAETNGNLVSDLTMTNRSLSSYSQRYKKVSVETSGNIVSDLAMPNRILSS